MLKQEKNIEKAVSHKSNKEVDVVLNGHRIDPDARILLEDEIKSIIENLSNDTIKEANRLKDKTIVSNHVRVAIEKFRKNINRKKKKPVMESLKVFGNLFLGIFLAYLVYMDQHNVTTPNYYILMSGVVGMAMVCVGLFKN